MYLPIELRGGWHKEDVCAGHVHCVTINASKIRTITVRDGVTVVDLGKVDFFAEDTRDDINANVSATYRALGRYVWVH